jgi:pimeloyl-ACP methyl ester carboxylesterase
LALRDPAFGAVVATQFLAGSVPVTAPLLDVLARVPLLRRIALLPFVRRPERLDPAVLRRSLQGAGSLAVAKILVRAGGIDYERIFTNIPQPVHLMWGANDRLIDATDIERARRDMRVVAEHVLPDCGHWPMIELPDDVARLLREIVDE